MNLMRKVLFLSTFLLFTIFQVNAQEWVTNLDEAKRMATSKNQKIILVFQGSDWCAPCIKLDKEIWSTEEFQQYAKKHFVMLKADFPRKKKNRLSSEQTKHNKSLAEKYNRQGFFPLAVVMNSEGKVLGQTGYKKMSPKQYIELLASFK